MRNNFIKITSLFLLIVFTLCIFPFTKSKYESNVVANFKNDVAIYLLETSFKEVDIDIPDLIPSLEPYIYNFTISNNDGENISEVNLEYDLYIKTTTNLPLNYKLYLNEDYEDPNATNIFESEELITDEYGTYYRKVGIPTRYFYYDEPSTDKYTLVIEFPIEYNNSIYENCIESIELIVDSKQVIN